MDKYDVLDGAVAVLATTVGGIVALGFIGFIGWATLFLLGLVSFGPFSIAEYLRFWGVGVFVIVGMSLSAYLLYGALMFTCDCFDDWRD